MKIIDEKGRLFGKINIIDFLVLVFVLCLTPMFYFGYKIMTKKPIVIEKPPTIQLDKAEYEQEIAEYKRAIVKFKDMITEKDRKRDVLLKEHKRLRRYFE